MATVESINSAGIISPVVTARTGNDTDNIRAFQRLRALADTRSANFQAALFKDDDAYTNFTNNDLLSLNSRSLDILNGIAPSTEDTLNSITQQNADQVAAVQAAATVSDQSAIADVLNLTTIQRENLTSIINEFSSAPFSQATFLQIQNALVSANINPQQISLQAILQQVFSGAAPTSNTVVGKTRAEIEDYESEAA
jgi:hypothetical protein